MNGADGFDAETELAFLNIRIISNPLIVARAV